MTFRSNIINNIWSTGFDHFALNIVIVYAIAERFLQKTSLYFILHVTLPVLLHYVIVLYSERSFTEFEIKREALLISGVLIRRFAKNK